jgi:hypothetical protein
MRVLLTNNTLDCRAGSELYIYDVAVELLRRGHQPIAFSTVLGPVADQLRDATVPVVDDLSRVATPPDVIHGHHHFETLLAVLSFPGVQAVNFFHGWTPWEEQPLVFPRVMRYVAVDQTCRDRLELEHGIPADRIDLVLNFVDIDRFRPRSPLPARPLRALAFGNPFSENDSAPVLRAACEKAGLELDIVGMASGRPLPHPETVLGNYDLVFAKARAALEAMAVGAAVILCGPRGLGPLVTPDNWDRLRLLNFGVRSLSLPMNVQNVLSEIARYDAGGAAAVSARVRSKATLHDAVDQLLALYAKAIREYAHGDYDSARGEIAAARYLRSHAATFKGRATSYDCLAELEQLRRQIAMGSGHSQKLEHDLQQERENRNQIEMTLESKRQELESTRQELGNTIEQLRMESGELKQLRFEVIESKHAFDGLERGLQEARAQALQEQSHRTVLEQQLVQAGNELAHHRRELRLLQESATWRIAQRAFQSAPFRAIAPLVNRFGRYIRSRPQRATAR